jgi:hypothetical protein
VIERSTADYVMKLFLPQPPAPDPHVTAPASPLTTEAGWQYQRDAQALCGEQEEGAHFHHGRTGKRLTLRHFEKMIDK